MNSILHRAARRFGKPVLEATPPWVERLTGFQTARGDYLPNRLRILTGRYEAEELDLMRPLLRPGQIIIDVGANVGYTARFFAQAVGRTGDVHAFEPNPVIYPLLKQNVASLERVGVYNLGLSSSKVLRRFSPRGGSSVNTLKAKDPGPAPIRGRNDLTIQRFKVSASKFPLCRLLNWSTFP